MFGYLVQRVLIMIPTLLVISAVTFIIIQAHLCLHRGGEGQVDGRGNSSQLCRRSPDQVAAAECKPEDRKDGIQGSE